MMVSTTAMNTALLQWHPPKELPGELLGYRLQYRRADEARPNTIDFGKDDQHFTVTGLHKGATYIFRLAAKNRAVRCVDPRESRRSLPYLDIGNHITLTPRVAHGIQFFKR